MILPEIICRMSRARAASAMVGAIVAWKTAKAAGEALMLLFLCEARAATEAGLQPRASAFFDRLLGQATDTESEGHPELQRREEQIDQPTLLFDYLPQICDQKRRRDEHTDHPTLLFHYLPTISDQKRPLIND